MGGAQMLFTPEMAGLADRDWRQQHPTWCPRRRTWCWRKCADAAARAGIWVVLGSIPVLRDDGRWANRCLVVDPRGEIAARYDKIHMFDVDLATGESWRESNAYAPGEELVT